MTELHEASRPVRRLILEDEPADVELMKRQRAECHVCIDGCRHAMS